MSGLAFINNYKPHKKLPEDAIEAYLKYITKKCTIKNISKPIIEEQYLHYKVVSVDIYNSFNKNNGRSDGKNLHYFTLLSNSKGWYVFLDCTE
ncbi:MAG TPA: hypothetical protein VIK72_11425 [Clostridiaceae bacterium]